LDGWAEHLSANWRGEQQGCRLKDGQDLMLGANQIDPGRGQSSVGKGYGLEIILFGILLSNKLFR
jgi:hypothetical protein